MGFENYSCLASKSTDNFLAHKLGTVIGACLMYIISCIIFREGGRHGDVMWALLVVEVAQDVGYRRVFMYGALILSTSTGCRLKDKLYLLGFVGSKGIESLYTPYKRCSLIP